MHLVLTEHLSLQCLYVVKAKNFGKPSRQENRGGVPGENSSSCGAVMFGLGVWSPVSGWFLRTLEELIRLFTWHGRCAG